MGGSRAGEERKGEWEVMSGDRIIQLLPSSRRANKRPQMRKAAPFTCQCLTKGPAKSQGDTVAASSGGGPGERVRWEAREPPLPHLVDQRG